MTSRSVLFFVALSLGSMPMRAQDAPGGIQETAPLRGVFRMRTPAGRPALGVVVDTRSGPTDSIGARIESVTPGGPAARAGIRSGDIITRFAGRSLVEYPPAGARPGLGSLPALQLIQLSAQLRPSDTVAIQLRRGRQTRQVRVVTEPFRDVSAWPDLMPGERVFAELQERFRTMIPLLEPGQPESYGLPARAMFIASPLGSLQLAPMNDELGPYFGTATGILVISVPKASGLGLRGGDVVLRVDGRTPMSPIHLIRILSSYGGGEGFKLDILRDRKRETVTGNLAANR